MKQKCPFCEKETADLLKHVSIYHNIKNIEEFDDKVKDTNEKKEKIKKFKEYTDSLMIQFRNNKISGEELRELRKKWEVENKLKW